MVMLFECCVRRTDGVRCRVDVKADTRFFGVRLAERIVSGGDVDLSPAAENVSFTVPRHESNWIPDETQAPRGAQHLVYLRDFRGIGDSILVRATKREDAIRKAEERFPGSTAVSLTVRWRVLGRCLRCGIHLFDDLPVRQTGRHFRCLDC